MRNQLLSSTLGSASLRHVAGAHFPQTKYLGKCLLPSCIAPRSRSRGVAPKTGLRWVWGGAERPEVLQDVPEGGKELVLNTHRGLAA